VIVNPEPGGTSGGNSGGSLFPAEFLFFLRGLISSQIISYINVSTLRITASYLAQEGIEIVKNIRDTNCLERASSWNYGLANG